MAIVRRGTPDDVEACVDVLAALPDHFTPDTHDDLRERYADCTVWVAEQEGRLIGCVHLQQDHPQSGEIHYAGVVPEHQRGGVGRQLVGRLLDEADLAVVEVRTLDASSGYQPYVGTRAFWEAMGFVQIDCIDPLPGWRPGNPSAIYVCALRPTRG
jgi:N-acetylglutamate synthase-like GNAT family acetyltransferase